MLVEEIEKAWVARAKSARFYPTPTFVGDRLMLGAEVEIARATVDNPYSQEEQLDRDARATTLFGAAFLWPINQRASAHLHCALQKHAEGDRPPP